MIEINSTRTKMAAATITVAYTLFYGLMPILLGNAADSRGLDDRDIGFLASVYMGGQTLGYFSGVFWIRAFPWRPLLVGSGVVFSASLVAASLLDGLAPMMGCLFLAGAAAAVGYGVTIACIGDTDEPERWYAFAWFMQAVVGTGLAYLLPQLGDLGQDFNSSIRISAVLVMLLMPLAILVPNRGLKSGDLRRPSDSGLTSVNPTLLLGLAVIVLVFIAESGLWSFLDRIAVSAGHTREFAGLVVAVSFVGAAVGSFVAGIISNRYGRLIPMAISIFASISAAALFYISDDRASLLTAAFVYGAAWNLGAPYRMALVAEADVSGRFATMIPGMQAIGSMIGPGLAGVLVLDGSFAMVYVAASTAWILALLLFIVAHRLQARAGRIGQHVGHYG